MNPVAAILGRIKSGENRFAPRDESIEALREFQVVVGTLREAERLELLNGLTVPPPSKGRDTYGLTTVAVVSGGLTYAGEQYLKNPPATASPTRAWVASHLAQFAVAVIAGVVVIIIAVRWGLQ